MNHYALMPGGIEPLIKKIISMFYLCIFSCSAGSCGQSGHKAGEVDKRCHLLPGL